MYHQKTIQEQHIDSVQRKMESDPITPDSSVKSVAKSILAEIDIEAAQENVIRVTSYTEMLPMVAVVVTVYSVYFFIRGIP